MVIVSSAGAWTFEPTSFNMGSKLRSSVPRRWTDTRERETQCTVLVREFQCFRRKHTSKALPFGSVPYSMPSIRQRVTSQSTSDYWTSSSNRGSTIRLSGPRRLAASRKRGTQRTFL